MSQKYTDARYPEKINDLIDNEGNVNPEIIPPAPTPEPGLKLYKHYIVMEGDEIYLGIELITWKSEPMKLPAVQESIYWRACSDFLNGIEADSDLFFTIDVIQIQHLIGEEVKVTVMGVPNQHSENYIAGELTSLEDTVTEIK